MRVSAEGSSNLMASASSPTTTLSRRRTQAPIPSPKKLSSFDDVVCQKSSSGKSPTKLLLCDKCDKGYHIFFLSPILAKVPKSSWFCPSCSHNSTNNPKSFPLVQTKIIIFFKIQRSSEAAQILNQDLKKKRMRGSSLMVSKKKMKLLAFTPSDDSRRRLVQMASLATALTAAKAEFSNELTYMPGMAPRDANCPALEHGGMQNNVVSVASILGGNSNNTGSGIAQRLVLKTGLNIIMACNILKNSPMVEN